MEIPADIRKELLYRANYEKYRYYKPIGKVEKFLDKLLSGDYMVGALLAANGIGKTTALVNTIGHLCFPCDNRYFQQPLMANWTYPKRGRIVSDPTTIRETIAPALEEWLPKDKYMTLNKGKNYPASWMTETGWEFDLMTYDQDPKEFESSTLGFCLEENTRILLANGVWRKIKDIKVGDKVISFGSGRYTGKKQPRKQVVDEVTNHIYMGRKPVYRMKGSKGFYVDATLDHKFFVSGKGWLPLEETELGDRVVTKEYDVEGEETISLDEAFLLGAWTGDGWFNKSIFFSCANEEFLEEFSGKVERVTHRKKYDYRIVAPEFRELLVSSGLSIRKAHNKFIPEFIFKSKPEVVVEFLKGLYAADGWFSSGTIGYASTSKELAQDLQLLLRRFNISAGVYFKKSQKEGVWRDQWFVLINRAADVLSFCDRVRVFSKREAQEEIYQTALNRRASRAKTAEKMVEVKREYDPRRKRNTRKTRKLVTIKSIEEIGVRDVYDISVEKNQNFLANGILTHNCFFDEPPPENIYKASIARLRKGGICGIFATPLMGSAWLYDEIVANPQAEKQYRFFMEAEVEDACKIHGVRGFLDHEQIEKMVAQYKDEDMVSRVFGKFQHLVGLIFKEFDKEVHVFKPFDLNSNDYCVYMSWDTHPREPEAIVWVAVDRKGRKYVVDHLWSDAPTPELVARVKAIDAKYRVVRRFLDPSGFIEDKRTGDSFANRLAREFGLSFEPGSKRRTDAIRAMQDAFHYEIAGGEMLVKPDLLVSETCDRVIWEILHWQWQEYNGKTADKRGKNPRPEDKNDHFIEAIGRVLLANPVFVEKQLDMGHGSSFVDNINEDPFN